MPWVEVIGYVGSVLVAGSLVMVSVVKLRVINLGGAVAFVAYGLLIGSYPLVLTNGFITVVNVYHLSRIFRADLNGFTYVSIDESRRDRLDEFIEAYRDDVFRFHPRFSLDFLDQAFAGAGRVYLAQRNLRTEGFAYYVQRSHIDAWPDEEVAGLFSAVDRDLDPARTAYVPVDYITRSYRDLGLVDRLHEQLIADLQPEVKFLVSIAERSCRKTNKFLAASGHVRAVQSEHYNLYVKTLA